MSHKSVRSRRFLLPAAVATAVVVAFATLPAAVAGQTGTTESQSSQTTSTSASAAPAAATNESAPSASAAPAAKASATTPSAPATSHSATSSSPAAPTKAPVQSPSALPTASSTPTDRIAEPQNSKAKTADTLVVAATPETVPGDKQAKLIVTTGGDRASGTTVTPLAGSKFTFYKVGNSSALTGGTVVGSCTTDASGKCSVIAELTEGKWFWDSDDNFFYATEVSTPSGWSNGMYWGSTSEIIAYNTGAITPGGSVSSRTKNLPGENRTWPNVRNNVSAPQKCGIDLAVVFDLSGSVSGDKNLLPKYKDAGKKFVDALTGTPSRIAIKTFASDAPATDPKKSSGANAGMPLTSVAQTGGAGATALKAKIEGFGEPENGTSTNWDAGLAQVEDNYDVVLFLTDGDPTTNSRGTQGGDIRDVEEAIHSANKIKADGAQVIAVGIGDSLSNAGSKQRLRLISGTKDGTDFFTTGFDGLGGKLTELAAKDCNGTVTVLKSVQDEAGKGTLAAGWKFTNSTSEVVASGTAENSGRTDIDGALNFKVSGYTQTTTSRKVAIAETQQPGFEMLKQGGKNAICVSKATGKAVEVQNQVSVPDGFTVDVPKADTITCSVVNKMLTSKISIVKTAAGYNGGRPVTGPDNAPNVPSGTSVAWTYKVTNDGTTTLNNIFVDDDQIQAAVSCPSTTLAPKASMICTATGLVKAQ